MHRPALPTDTDTHVYAARRHPLPSQPCRSRHGLAAPVAASPFPSQPRRSRRSLAAPVTASPFPSERARRGRSVRNRSSRSWCRKRQRQAAGSATGRPGSGKRATAAKREDAEHAENAEHAEHAERGHHPSGRSWGRNGRRVVAGSATGRLTTLAQRQKVRREGHATSSSQPPATQPANQQPNQPAGGRAPRAGRASRCGRPGPRGGASGPAASRGTGAEPRRRRRLRGCRRRRAERQGSPR